MGPCLRYLDEHLLLLCGASLIVPFGTSLPRFLGLLDSLSGQLWTRSLPDDLDATLKRLCPPALCGLLPARAGLDTPERFLAWLSSQIERLQTQPGRLAQTLEQASLDVWSTPTSGLARNAPTNTVSASLSGARHRIESP